MGISLVGWRLFIMLWLLLTPIVLICSLLSASLCIVARDSDEFMEELYKKANR